MEPSEQPQTRGEGHLLGGYSGIFFNQESSPASAAPPLQSQRNMVVAGSLLVFAAVVVILAGIKSAQVVFAPFCLACFLAIILTAPLRWLKGRGFSDLSATIVLIIGVLICGISIIWILSGSVNKFIARVPEYTAQTNKLIGQIDDFLEPYGLSLKGGVKEFKKEKKRNPAEKSDAPEKSATEESSEKSKETIAVISSADILKEPSNTANEEKIRENRDTETNEKSKEEDTLSGEEESENKEESEEKRPALPNGDVFPYVQNPWEVEERDPIRTVGIAGYMRYGMSELGRLATLSFIVMILVIFMLLEASRLPRKIVNAFGTNGITNEHLQTIVDKVWKYMFIKSIISFFVGTLVWLLLIVNGVDYAMLWALLAFFLNFVPNIGSIIAAVPGIALAYFDHGAGTCAIVAIGYLLINQGLGYYVEPIWLGEGLGISPLVILLSLIFFGYLLGMIGMFLSAPLAIVMKIVLDSFDETRWLGTLMGS
jgi:predicted PurR-regulated permease PerM